MQRYVNITYSSRRSNRLNSRLKQQQDAQLSQRYCAAGCVSFGQKWKTNCETIFYGHVHLLTRLFYVVLYFMILINS